MRKRALFAAGLMVAALVVASGVAWAATIRCPNRDGNLCVGTDNKDTMIGRDGRSDDMRAKGSADEVRGRGGADTLSGGPGADTLTGALGKDTLNGAEGPDSLKGGSADDIYDFHIDNWGNDTITDTTDSDTDPLTGDFAQFGFPKSLGTGLTIDLASSASSPEVKNGALTGTVNWSNDAVDGVYVDSQSTDESITIHNTINGNAAANQLIAKGGEKTISTINAGAGNDWISVSDFAGGEGVDTVYFDAGDTGPNPLTQAQPINCELINP
jgi:hypothetical protein